MMSVAYGSATESNAGYVGGHYGIAKPAKFWHGEQLKLKNPKVAHVFVFNIGRPVADKTTAEISFNAFFNPEYRNELTIDGDEGEVDHLRFKPRSLAVFANVYRELLHMSCVTIYAGGGIGISQNKMRDIIYVRRATSGSGETLLNPGNEVSRFAWNVAIGAHKTLSPTITWDLFRYTYYDLGKFFVPEHLGNTSQSFRFRAHNFSTGLRLAF